MMDSPTHITLQKKMYSRGVPGQDDSENDIMGASRFKLSTNMTRIRWVGHVARAGEMASACEYRGIVGKPEAKTALVKSRLTKYTAG